MSTLTVCLWENMLLGLFSGLLGRLGGVPKLGPPWGPVHSHTFTAAPSAGLPHSDPVDEHVPPALTSCIWSTGPRSRWWQCHQPWHSPAARYLLLQVPAKPPLPHHLQQQNDACVSCKSRSFHKSKGRWQLW